MPPPHLQPKAKTSPGLLFGFIHTKVTWLLHLIRWFADFSASPLISVWSKNAVTAQQDRTCVHKSVIVALQLSGTASQRSLRCDFEGIEWILTSQSYVVVFLFLFFTITLPKLTILQLPFSVLTRKAGRGKKPWALLWFYPQQRNYMWGLGNGTFVQTSLWKLSTTKIRMLWLALLCFGVGWIFSHYCTFWCFDFQKFKAASPSTLLYNVYFGHKLHLSLCVPLTM